jgi:S-adenosylmethionine decarboxylase
MKEAWGFHTLLDLYGCASLSIRNKDLIKYYVEQLCFITEMKPFGECKIVHFGQDPSIEGFSLIQLIETSLISGHFCNQENSAYIDIFSCKYYDHQLVSDFTKKIFEADRIKTRFILRK